MDCRKDQVFLAGVPIIHPIFKGVNLCYIDFGNGSVFKFWDYEFPLIFSCWIYLGE